MNPNVGRPPRTPVGAVIINNDAAAAKQCVIFTNAANDLALQLTNPGTAAWSLTGGSSVPDQASFDPLKGQAPASSVFYLMWPASATITFDPSKLTAPAGWNIALFPKGTGAPYLGVGPSADVSVQPGDTIEFQMKGVTALAGQPPAPTLDLDGYFLVTAEPLSTAGTAFQTQIHAKPSPGRQPLDLWVDFIQVTNGPKDLVTLTPEGEARIHADLAIVVRNNSSEALIPPGSKATGNEQIAISYTVGDDDTEGVLAALADVQLFPAPDFQSAQTGDWSGNIGADGATFLVTPKLAANPQILAANGRFGDQVVILLNNLFSNNRVQPDSAQMTVTISGFTDYSDQAYLLTIDKLLPPGIIRFQADKSTIRQGDTVELSWLIAAVPSDSPRLDGLPQGSLVGTQIPFMQTGFSVVITADTKLTLSTTATVDKTRQQLEISVKVLVPKITSFDVTPGYLNVMGSRTSTPSYYVLNWTAENFSTITLNGRSMDPTENPILDFGGSPPFTLVVTNEFGFSDSASYSS